MNRPSASESWLSEIELETLFSMFRENGAEELLFKVLPRNANSKNQVYLASDMSQLGKIPSGRVTLHESTSLKSGKVEAVFRSALQFYWIDSDGKRYPAPHAKLIFYPQYPEVRFSGFLRGCRGAPSFLFDKQGRGEEPGRVLVLGVRDGREVLGIALPPESPAASQLKACRTQQAHGAFQIIRLPGQKSSGGYQDLMRELCNIHHRSWVRSSRLDKNGVMVPCNSSNCNGNTLESLLGIRSNGYSKPDYLGWELKARSVPNCERPGASVVTLFTPEPTSGAYTELEFKEFMRRYGYPDTQNRPDRVNFGGIYRTCADFHPRTGLRLVLEGFDPVTHRYQATGAIRLIDRSDNEALGWTFEKLMDHWKAKHAFAAFVPSQVKHANERMYRFGKNVMLGEGAEFRLFLTAVHEGMIYYDPGIKLERDVSGKHATKKRSQFRINSKNIPLIYVSSREVDVCVEAEDGREQGKGN